jgi:hypothetical protein
MNMPRSDASEWVWQKYWAARGEPWRSAPECKPKRRQQLQLWRDDPGSVSETGVGGPWKRLSPFAGRKLTRSDVEWLLHTHDGGPVIWDEHIDVLRESIDLAGADLTGVDLSELPLACCSLSETNLRKANLSDAFLQGADLSFARLDEATLADADLRRASLVGTHFESSSLAGTQLGRSNLNGAVLNRHTSLDDAHLADSQGYGPSIAGVDWGGADLTALDWRRKPILGEELAAAGVSSGPHLPDRAFTIEMPEGDAEALEARGLLGGGGAAVSELVSDALKAATDSGTPSERRARRYALSARANLQFATVLRDQGLNNIAHHYAYRSRVEERKALFCQSAWSYPTQASPRLGLRRAAAAVYLSNRRRSRRTLTRLCLQLMRAARWMEKRLQPVLDTVVHSCRCVWSYARWLGSLGLSIVAGYGYKPIRCVLAYASVILVFAGGYVALGERLPSAVFTSMYAFHGRGLGPGFVDRLSVVYGVGAAESLLGLVLEITFIATFTQRLLRG